MRQKDGAGKDVRQVLVMKYRDGNVLISKENVLKR